jgi:hypothetical protein
VDEFKQWARATFRRAGIDVDDDDVELAELVYRVAFAQLTLLDDLDFDRYPFEPVDPSTAPRPA